MRARDWQERHEANLRDANGMLATLIATLGMVGNGPERQKLLAAIAAEARVLLVAASALDHAANGKKGR